MPPKPKSERTSEDDAAEDQSRADAPITLGDIMADKAGVPVVVAIARVIRDLPAIQKNDRGDGVSYKFRGVETLVGHVAGLLARHGVIIVPSSKLISRDEVISSKSGTAMHGWNDVILEVSWRIYGPGGDYIEAVTYGIGRDNSDKGANKAQTQAYKYLLMELFAIGDKEDDSDGIPLAEPVASAPARSSAPVPDRSGGQTAPAASTAPPPTPVTISDAQRGKEEVTLDGTSLERLSTLRRDKANKSDGQWTAALATIARQVGQLPADLTSMVQNEAIWAAAAIKFELT